MRCSAGSRVQVRVPQRGDKRALLETVTRNAQEEFTRHRLRRASDHNTRSRALTELQEHLGLPEAPLRIECYDMAHLQGTDYVGSMVVLEDGLPNKREYRRFKVHVPGNDDYAAMEEVLTRRLTAYLAERDRPPPRAGRAARQVRLPAAAARRRRRQGPARRRRAGRARARAGGRDPGRRAGQALRGGVRARAGREPVEIPRGSEALFMLQRIRDEAHRFANTFHGERRSKRMTASVLDGIPGLGETRKKRLVKELGGVNAVKRRRPRRPAGADAGCPTPSPRPIHAKFHPDGCPTAAVRVSTVVVAVPDTPTRRVMTDDLWERHAAVVDRRVHRGRRPGVRRADPAARRRRAGRRPTGARRRVRRRPDHAAWPPALDGVELAVGVDPTWNQIRVAAGARRRDRLRRAPAADGLPFADGSFDAVVACLVFEHIDDVDEAIAEVARVLAPGGRFCFFLNHPLLQTPGSGWIDDQVLDPPEQYWRIGPYLVEAVTVEEVEQGVHIRFVHRPLSRYVNALADHGLLVERMVEPAPPPGFLALAPEYADAATVPRLLYLRTRRDTARGD